MKGVHNHSSSRLVLVLVLLLGRDNFSWAQDEGFTISGNVFCPCIDVQDQLIQQSVFGTTSGISCVVEDGKGSTPGALSSNGLCYPLNFGSLECRQWEKPIVPACSSAAEEQQPKEVTTTSTSGSSIPPQWCYERWCYVDRTKCHSSLETYYQSTIFPDLFYSYSTCGSQEESWLQESTTDSLTNASLVVGIPDIWYPVHYKWARDGEGLLDNDSPDVYSPSLHWHGTILDYFRDIVAISNIRDVTYTYRSKGSQRKNISSSYTQAVSDVEAQIVDAAIGTIWVTAERLQMTPFTIPIIRDSFKLWVPMDKNKNGGEKKTVQENFGKLKQPFTDGLWYTIMGSIVVYAVLSAYVSPKKFRQFSKRKTSFWGKTKRASIILSDAFNLSALEFLGGAVDTGVREANLSQKWLNFGFALVTFICITAYTANLAAFLTLKGSVTTITSIEQATEANIRICVNHNLREEILALYPHTQFVFGGGNSAVLDDYDNGKCNALIQGWVDIYVEPEAQLWYCSRGLTRVGQPLLEYAIAFSANRQIVAGLSHWIAEAHNQKIHFMDYIRRTPLVCPLELDDAPTEEESDDSDLLLQFSLANMQVPFLVFFCSCIMALLIHFWKWLYYRKGDKKRGVRSYVRQSLGMSKRFLGISQNNLHDEIAEASRVNNNHDRTGSSSTFLMEDRMPRKLQQPSFRSSYAAANNQNNNNNNPRIRSSPGGGLPRRLPKANKLRSVDDMNRAIEEYLDYQQHTMNEQRQSMEELLAYQQTLLARSAELSSSAPEQQGGSRKKRRPTVRAVRFDFDDDTFEDEYDENRSAGRRRRQSGSSYLLDSAELESLAIVEV